MAALLITLLRRFAPRNDTYFNEKKGTRCHCESRFMRDEATLLTIH